MQHTAEDVQKLRELLAQAEARADKAEKRAGKAERRAENAEKRLAETEVKPCQGRSTGKSCSQRDFSHGGDLSRDHRARQTGRRGYP